MSIDEWMYSKILASTSVTAITTSVSPDFLPRDITAPAIVYINNIGWDKNLLIRQPIISIVGYHNTKTGVQSLSDALYNIFDTSTAYVKETSSNINVESVQIVNSITGRYNRDNDNWYCVLDVLVNYWERR